MNKGSTEFQIKILTKKISLLKKHLLIHNKDFHSRYGLSIIINKKKKLLKYLK
ncbi:30S ribosomal protein S15 [Candidatus Vidania fulgoroideorum]